MSFCLTVKIYYLRLDDDRSSTEATYGNDWNRTHNCREYAHAIRIVL